MISDAPCGSFIAENPNLQVMFSVFDNNHFLNSSKIK